MFTIKQAHHLIAWYLRFNDLWAITMPYGDIYILPEVSADPVKLARMKKHEHEHEFQMAREGKLKFLLKYFYYQLRFGYWDNPYEVEARRVENA